jgi:hypothetical protein
MPDIFDNLKNTFGLFTNPSNYNPVNIIKNDFAVPGPSGAHDPKHQVFWNMVHNGVIGGPRTPAPAPAAPAPAAPTDTSNGPGDGGYGAALGSINDQYAKQLAGLTSARDTAAKDIGAQHAASMAAMQSNNAGYGAESERINNQILNRIAQQIADSHAAAQQTNQFVNAFGLNGGAIAANAANINRTNQNVSQYQQDLMARLQQVQRGAQSNYANSSALVNQGATGRLTTNYNLGVNSLNQAKEQAIAKAQSAAAAAASRASKQDSPSTQLRNTMAQYKMDILGRWSPKMYAAYSMWKAQPTTEGYTDDQINEFGSAYAVGL